MHVRLHSSVLSGADALPVTVEVDAMGGFAQMTVVGLPGSMVRESRDRVRTAIRRSGYTYPMQRLVVNLAPADMPKRATHFDLPIAVGVLAATSQVSHRRLASSLLFGELALSGEVLPSRGGAVLAEAALHLSGITHVLSHPSYGAVIAAYAPALSHVPISHLRDAVAFLQHGTIREYGNEEMSMMTEVSPLFSRITGLLPEKRVIALAAAGGHHILLTGPPGSGKTMLARAVHDLLPDLPETTSREVRRLYAVAGEEYDHRSARPPFREVGREVTQMGLLGGGRQVQPGEISLAHGGVLFMDELLEMPRPRIEALRGPLEEKRVILRRDGQTVKFPGAIQLVATANPCPCGYAGDLRRRCVCTSTEWIQYQKKLSGPLRDRFDIALLVSGDQQSLLAGDADGQDVYELFRSKVHKARSIQYHRQGGLNGDLPSHLLAQYAPLDPAARRWFLPRIHREALSMRRQTRILRVARTLGDMEEVEILTQPLIEEAYLLSKGLLADEA